MNHIEKIIEREFEGQQVKITTPDRLRALLQEAVESCGECVNDCSPKYREISDSEALEIYRKAYNEQLQLGWDSRTHQFALRAVIDSLKIDAAIAAEGK